MKKVAIALLLAVTAGSPAAAATITFTPNTTALPSYTTATVIQAFEQSGASFAVNTTNTAGTESVGGSSRANISPADPSMVNKFLTLGNGASYTLDFGSSPVQFLAFLIDNYRATNHVKLRLSDGSTAANVLNAVSGLTGGDSGLVVIDRQGGAGIAQIEFQTGSGPNNSFSIDEIAVAAPEPATWGMMLLGFGVVGAHIRQRRKSAVGGAAGTGLRRSRA